MQLLLIEAGKLTEAHIHDGLALQLVEGKASFQGSLGIDGSLAFFDDIDHLVDVVACNDETFQDVGPFLCLAQVVLRAPDGYVVPVLNKVADEIPEGEKLWASLDQGNAVDAEARLERCHLEELVQHDACIGIALQIYYNAHAFAVALVVDVADAFYLLFTNKLCNVFNELLLVDAVGYFADDNLVVCVAVLYLGFCTKHDASASGLVGIANSLHAHDVCSGGEVGTFHVVHEVVGREFVVIDVCHACIDNFAEVVSGYVGSHTYGNTCCAVDEQVGYLCGHDGRLLERVVEVVGHIDCFFLQVIHHGLTHQAESRLGVSHGSGAVAVDTAEVALSVHQCVSHCPLLGHAYQSHIYGAVAVWVVLAEHFAHDTCTLLVRIAMEIAQFAHAIEDTAVNGLESVSYVRQGASHNDRHRVVDVALLHFLLDVNFDYSFLVFH